MTIFQVKVTGWEPVEAGSAEEAVEKFSTDFIDRDYLVRDLRWKSISIENANPLKELERQLDELRYLRDGLKESIALVEQQRDVAQKKFDTAIEMLRDKEDRYGIGSMCSQWRSDEIADDILQRLQERGL